jgi:hypothetical protein
MCKWSIARSHNLLSVIVDLFQVLSRRSAENDLSQLQDPTGNANTSNSVCLIFG